MSRTCPEWSGVCLADCAKYLGFFTGRGKGEKSWDKPMLKYGEAAEQWCKQALGLQYAALAYNTFAMSVLSFVCQLERPPARLLDKEKAVLRKVVVGPGEWAIPSDLWFLKENFSQARSFRCVEILAFASQVRVAKCENAANGGLKVLAKSRELKHVLDSADFLDRRQLWHDWYINSHVHILGAAIQKFQAEVLPNAPQPPLGEILVSNVPQPRLS